MYVKCDRSDLRVISLPGMEGSAEFSQTGIAQVTAADGEVLLDEYPDEFSEHDTETNDD